jgi:hypothetical protein
MFKWQICYTEMTDFFTVHNDCSKVPRTTQDLRTRLAKCIEIDGGIFESLLRTVTDLLQLRNK